MSDFNDLTYVVVPSESLTDYMLSVVPETRSSARRSIDEEEILLKFDPEEVVGDAFEGLQTYSHEEILEVINSEKWGDSQDLGE